MAPKHGSSKKKKGSKGKTKTRKVVMKLLPADGVPTDSKGKRQAVLEILKKYNMDPEAPVCKLTQLSETEQATTPSFRMLNKDDMRALFKHIHINQTMSLSVVMFYAYLSYSLDGTCAQNVTKLLFDKLEEHDKAVGGELPPDQVPSVLFQRESIRSLGIMSRGNKPDLNAVQEIIEEYGLTYICEKARAVQLAALQMHLVHDKLDDASLEAGRAARATLVSIYQECMEDAEEEGDGGVEDNEDDDDSNEDDQDAHERGAVNHNVTFGGKSLLVTNEKYDLDDDSDDSGLLAEYQKGNRAKRKLLLDQHPELLGKKKRAKQDLVCTEDEMCGYVTCRLCQGGVVPDFTVRCTFDDPCNYTTCEICHNPRAKSG